MDIPDLGILIFLARVDGEPRRVREQLVDHEALRNLSGLGRMRAIGGRLGGVIRRDLDVVIRRDLDIVIRRDLDVEPIEIQPGDMLAEQLRDAAFG